MADEKMATSGIPKIDFSKIRKRVTRKEAKAAYEAIENAPKRDWRAFVAHIEAHPEDLISWDMPMSFSEFAKRVKAGEYD